MMIKYTEKQQQAIDTIDKNLQIIACAGSGKTQVISQRVVTILKERPEIEPKNILAFTYTEKAATELKTRILALCKEQLGDIKGLAEMYVGTIHSWCLQAIQDNVYEYQKFTVLDEIKLKLFIDKFYSEIGMADVGMDRYLDTSKFITIMSVLREAEISPGETLPGEWLNALKRFEDCLYAHSYFDFTTIMTEAIRNLKENAGFREIIFKQLKYLIVDEYQDVNPVQEDLINELSLSGANICVVGDDDQTIFQWRGSDVRYIQNFQNRYTDVSYIKLEDNFRSTPGIVDAALKCITNNTNRLPKIMNSTGHQKFDINDILYNQYDCLEDEIRFIIDNINKQRGLAFQDNKDARPRGLDYSDVAILIRTWKKAKPIMDELANAGIPFVVGGVNELFQRPEIIASKAIFDFLSDDIEESTLFTYWEAVSRNVKKAALKNAVKYLKTKRPKPDTFYSTFSIQEIFWTFIEKADLREDIFVDKSDSGIVGNEINEVIYYNLGMFSQMINDFETIHFKDRPKFKLSRFLSFLKYSADGYYPEGWLNNSFRAPNAVQIMTIFQAKGLEFPTVFVPGLNRNYLPIKRPGGKQIWHYIDRNIIKDQGRYETSVEDERRLMYVAITRSQKYLTLSRSIENRLYQKESIFAKEVSNSDFVITVDNPDYGNLTTLSPLAKYERGAIQLNFSVLKAFFDCPYRFKLVSLYGFVQPITERIGYGNSIHNILMELHRKYLEGTDISKENVEELAEKHVHIPYATEQVIKDIKQSAINVTKKYIKENERDFPNIEYAEKEIQINIGDGILVNGRMDLIKKKDLGGTEVTTIVDFKSSKDAQRDSMTMEQLSLYALGYQELSGTTADFLQIFNLDEDGHSKTTQPLDNNQLVSIKQKIIDSAGEIRGNNFVKTKNNKKCGSCIQKRLCTGII
jgi:DNA helicase II / ATP-dependent DNA helicase PcrA